MWSDTLSEVLRAVRLQGAVFYDVVGTSPWVEESPEAVSAARAALPSAEHLVSFHAVSEGTCWVEAPGHAPVRLAEGDVIVLPHGDAHVLASAPGLRAGEAPPTRPAVSVRELPLSLRGGSGGDDRVRMACGFLGCDRLPFNPLVAALPRVLVVRHGGDRSLLPLVRLAIEECEARRSGGQAVLARISELLFLEAIRSHVDSLPEDRTGWLAGLRDPHVGRALSALHERPSAAWTLAALARETGLSRSALAERFTKLVGQPPMQYLGQWRLQLAAGLLASGAKVASAAADVGYDSEAAFSRAFKRVVGLSPTGWRERQLTAGARTGRASVRPPRLASGSA